MSDTDSRAAAEESRALTLEYFRVELTKINDALAVIETTDVDDWNTFAEQFTTAAEVADNLATRFVTAFAFAASINAADE